MLFQQHTNGEASSMISLELIQTFGFAALLCMACSYALSIHGSLWSARSEEILGLCMVQLLCIFHIVFEHWIHGSVWMQAVLLLASASFVLSSIRRFSASNRVSTRALLSAYLSLLALTFLALSIFPSVEAQGLKSIFGDIVTITQNETFILFPIFIFILVFSLLHFKSWTSKAFLNQVLDTKILSWKETILGACAVSLSILFFGPLFVMTFLIVCPFFASSLKDRSFRAYSNTLLFLSFSSVFFGFYISLSKENWPTSPAITMALVFLFLLLVSMKKIKTKLRRMYAE